jgi:hypothetical protein
LISTGIGALVVAIGLLVANWDKLTAAIGNSTFMLKRRQKLLEKNSELNKAQIELLEKRIELLGDEDKSLDELQKKRKKVAEDDIKTQEENVKIQKKLLEETAQDYLEAQVTASLPLTQSTAGLKLYNFIFGVTEQDVKDVQLKLKETEGAYVDSQQKLVDIENEKTQNLINELERQQAVEEAKGNETIELERRILTEKVKLYKEGTEEYKDAQNDIKVFEANTERERTEKLKEEEEKRKELLKLATEKRIQLLQEQLVAQGEYYNRLSELRVIAGDSGTPGIIDDIQKLIDENKNFIKSVTETDEPLDNLVKTFDLLSQSILTLSLRQRKLATPEFINQITTLQRKLQDGELSIEKYNQTVRDLNKTYFGTSEGLDLVLSKGDEFGEFYDRQRGRLLEVFLGGDREEFDKAIEKVFRKFQDEFKDTEDFFEKERILAGVIDGYQRAFIIANQNITKDTQTTFKKFFGSLKDKLILEDIIKFDEKLPDELKTLAGEYENIDELREKLSKLELEQRFLDDVDGIKQVERYGISIERLRDGTIGYTESYKELLKEFEKGVRDGLTPKELLETPSEDIKALATTQLDAFIKVVTQTTAVEDGIRGVSFEYQQLNKELLSQSKNIDLLIGTIESDFERITKGMDLEQFLVIPDENTDKFKTDLDAIITQLEKFGLDRVVIENMTSEEQLRIIEIFGEKAKKENEETKKEIEQIWQDGFLSLYGELSNFIISVSDRITENRIRNAELARDAEIRAIDDVEEAYNLQQQNLSNADKARLAKQKEFEQQRDVIRKKSGKEIAELEMKNAMLQWELRLGEAVSTTALNVIKALGQPPFPGTNIAAATLAGTLGGLQIATLFAQMPKMSDFQSFSTGGMVTGPGTTTSDSIPAFLSNGESVINAKSTQMFLPQLDMINKMGGGSPLIQGYNKGGMVQGGTTIVDTSGMEEIMMSMNNRPIKAYVVSQDITDAQHNDDILKKRTTF